ncbi:MULTISPECIES: 2Fe-2S iron-sulfur cluster-binding protein [Rhodococcus]|jgi:2Fe-2S ferredoxin|uniref:2Fe-2S iron-sulfur cluster-binding protein n=1 Tax=Rhodococcus globerulus TaxID=33008 RepID=A0ABU4BZ08_RHOGO|nr:MULTISPECIES: 2Fe-2S iron-sulfur cluster-binding protein [Rhodococcus]MDV6269304.1 2Fe-2S iron-sulfur cluster-binding protein [Rhodococcus globerulus]MDV8066653.1 2Fe-2S iron-sulfur cluster-binding protein [Rhodococcus sp. IEGM 1366]
MKVTFKYKTGEGPVTLDVEDGLTLMEAARLEGVDGILADCGGGAICGTCHVVVDSVWFDKCGPLDATEDVLLGLSPEREGTSRLACQIEVVDAVDGISVTVPESQI